MSALVTKRREIVPTRAILIPMAAVAGLLALLGLPSLRGSPQLVASFLGAGGTILVAAAALWLRSRREDRPLSIEVAIYKHHWVQSLTQLAVLFYWGWHVRFVYAFLPLILAQILFAYGVESLLHWTRRRHYRFGFGPMPIVLSINLFLWFRPEWFYWQFALIVVGYLGKDLIRWRKDGRSAHIFNPSSFPLAVGSIFLVLTGSTDLTLGREIAQTQFYPPNMYLWLFLVSLPVQILFGVARVTMAAVATLLAISYGYFAATGIYLFVDAHISVPVFLGTLLLITDPSTSPRSDTGQVVFGVLYGLGVTGFYVLLAAIGAPVFYDKLLPVPLLNLTVRGIERWLKKDPVANFDLSRVARGLSPRLRFAGYTGIWALFFVTVRTAGGVGDEHPGQYLTFWQEACREGNAQACAYTVAVTARYCEQGSGWACNEWGAHLVRTGEPEGAEEAFRRSCELGFDPGCRNVGRAPEGAGSLARAAPSVDDLPIVLRGSKGPIRERDRETLFALACEQGWPGFCDRITEVDRR